MLLVVDDLITEGLESDNLTLQNLSANKFVQARGSLLPYKTPCKLPHCLHGLQPLQG